MKNRCKWIDADFSYPALGAFVNYFCFSVSHLVTYSFYTPAMKSWGGILIYPCLSVRPFVRSSVRPSRYRYMFLFITSCIKGTWFVWLTPPTVLELQLMANSSYSFRATALIFCRMFIHIGGVHVHKILIFIKYSQNDR